MLVPTKKEVRFWCFFKDLQLLIFYLNALTQLTPLAYRGWVSNSSLREYIEKEHTMKRKTKKGKEFTMRSSNLRCYQLCSMGYLFFRTKYFEQDGKPRFALSWKLNTKGKCTYEKLLEFYNKHQEEREKEAEKDVI